MGTFTSNCQPLPKHHHYLVSGTLSPWWCPERRCRYTKHRGGCHWEVRAWWLPTGTNGSLITMSQCHLGKLVPYGNGKWWPMWVIWIVQGGKNGSILKEVNFPRVDLRSKNHELQKACWVVLRIHLFSDPHVHVLCALSPRVCFLWV